MTKFSSAVQSTIRNNINRRLKYISTFPVINFFEELLISNSCAILSKNNLEQDALGIFTIGSFEAFEIYAKCDAVGITPRDQLVDSPTVEV